MMELNSTPVNSTCFLEDAPLAFKWVKSWWIGQKIIILKEKEEESQAVSLSTERLGQRLAQGVSSE